eukprot:6458477-Amphidinium_carterae.1
MHKQARNEHIKPSNKARRPRPPKQVQQARANHALNTQATATHAPQASTIMHHNPTALSPSSAQTHKTCDAVLHCTRARRSPLTTDL